MFFTCSYEPSVIVQVFSVEEMVAISTVLCQKGLSDIFCHFLLFRDYDTTADNTSPVKFLEANCVWK